LAGVPADVTLVEGLERRQSALTEQPRREAQAAATDVRVWTGDAADLGLSPAAAERARMSPGRIVSIAPGEAEPPSTGEADGSRRWGGPRAVVFDELAGQYIGVTARAEGARRAVVRLYVLMTLTLLAVYGLIAASLE